MSYEYKNNLLKNLNVDEETATEMVNNMVEGKATFVVDNYLFIYRDEAQNLLRKLIKLNPSFLGHLDTDFLVALSGYILDDETINWLKRHSYQMLGEIILNINLTNASRLLANKPSMLALFTTDGEDDYFKISGIPYMIFRNKLGRLSGLKTVD